MVIELVVVICGYLLGCIPGAYIITRLIRGEDIRKLDTGNVGAASVFRSSGIFAGALTSIIDCGKGIAAVLLAQYISAQDIWILMAGFAAIIGHCYPIFLKFHGGQGVATTIGVFLILAPLSIAIVLGVLAVVLFINWRFFFQRIFFSICVAAPFLPLFLWFLEKSQLLTFYSIFIILVIGIKNRRSFLKPLEPSNRK